MVCELSKARAKKEAKEWMNEKLGEGYSVINLVKQALFESENDTREYPRELARQKRKLLAKLLKNIDTRGSISV